MDATKCEHFNFYCEANIGRLTETDGDPVMSYTAGIKIKCVDCGLRFRFIGLPAGTHHSEPRVSIDGTELRAPLEPAQHEKFMPFASYTMPPKQKQ